MNFSIRRYIAFNVCSLMALAALLLTLFTQPQEAAAETMFEPKDLVGTIWLAPEAHSRTTIDRFGKISLKTGKNIYVEFLSENQGVFSIKIHWWNVEAKINVVEYAVMAHENENVYVYVEAEHPDDSSFPGISAGGNFTLLSETEAEMTQIGRLLNGSASAFITRLEKVSAAPDIPIKQSYPPIK